VRTIRLPLLPILVLLQLPLILNVGYFSHDDLEWLARADVPTWGNVPWVAWLDDSLQYRPLTFNAWLAIAHLFGHAPQAMHLVGALLGALNGWLLARVLRALGVLRNVAYGTAIVFVLSPAAVYVHGWTGALADTLTLTYGLAATLALFKSQATLTPRSAAYAAIGVGCIALALLCKESAIVLPMLIPLALLHRYAARSRHDATASLANPTQALSTSAAHGFSRPATVAVAFSALLAGAYLGVRWPTLHDSARIAPAYAWSIANIPARLVEYFFYPFMLPLFEIAPLLAKSPLRIAAAAACATALLGALATAGRRWPIAWIAAFVVALAPVLVLGVAYNQYAYLATAASIAIVATAWSSMHRAARFLTIALASIVVLHGAALMLRIREVGAIQQNLLADLVAHLEHSPSRVRLVPADARDVWIPRRLLDGVAIYRGTTLRDRVLFDGADAVHDAETLTMARDGHLSPAAALTRD
jgi:hypothetical protein